MAFVLLALLLLGSGNDGDSEADAALQRFAELYAAVEREAAERINPEHVFYEGAIPGMLRRLDPHSVFMDPGEFEQLKRMQESRQKGFGSVVSVLPGRVIVLQTLPGTPSAKAGLEAGDEIIAINGYRIDRLEFEQLVALLTESRKRRAGLDVRRPGNARVLQFVLTPEEMQSPSVDRTYFLRAGVGYVRVTSFDLDTGQRVQEAIEKLGGNKLKALVLDLRDNPGGALPAALHTASLFLKPGQTILSVRGRRVTETAEKVPERTVPYEFPLALLIGDRTASAAEIVAGALQDNDRATLVGEPSFGKGLVQAVYPLSNGAGLALTTSYYFTPSGRSIQRPLKGSQLENTPAARESGQEFKSAAGRPLRGGGGIVPDRVVHPAALTPLRTVLSGSGVIVDFATEYLRAHPRLSEEFEVSPALLDEFQVYLSGRNIRPSVAEWSKERPWITHRLKTEIVTQAFGVARGEEVEAQQDPRILEALKVLGVE